MKKSMIASVVLVAIFVLSLSIVGLAAADLKGITVRLVEVPADHFQAGGFAEGRLQEAEKLFNCTIELQQEIDCGFPEIPAYYMSRLLAGDTANEVWMFDHRMFWPVAVQGGFLPISDYVGPDCWDAMPELFKPQFDHFEFLGKRYGFAVTDMAPQFVAWNKVLFEREGLPNLYDLVEAGEWTWDKAIEVAQQATRDTDNDGEIDQWGFSTWSVKNTFNTNANEAYDVMLIDGRYVFTADSEPFLRAYEYQQRAFEQGLEGPNTFAQGNVAMQTNGLWKFHWEGIAYNMEDDYGFVPLPMGPDTDKYHITAEGLGVAVLPSNCANPEGFIELMSFLYPPEELYTITADFHQPLMRDRESWSYFEEGMANWDPRDCAMVYSWVLGTGWEPQWLPYKEAQEAIRSGEKSPATAFAEVKPWCQSQLDEKLNSLLP